MKKLEHISIIDFCYWRLEELNKKLSYPQSPIEAAIDNACGYDRMKELKDDAISLVEQIIESKKAIDVDYTGDNAFLEKLKSN
ncbi:hypothetical protein AAE250_20660 [Bacteroides sp. GD17]|jgi:hypothetical protein|uniref:hypothetical protein n=1 Tax=Bacteroides sp. GD17 TaxID=3139826 RepID=UPI00206C2DB6|nr:hypothetical protein [uncultured Bacteroides sp.]DAV89720.1 MAG TPA: hypothetical protein [Caudoviricetes sp.]